MGSGKNVTYLAPDLPGTTTIRLTVSADTALLYSRSFSVFVFKQLVVLKADDMTYFSSSTIAPEWLRYINFIKARNIHASLGLKGYSLTEGTAEYFSFLTSLQHSGLFELWNHGYTHELNEVNSQGQTFDEFQNTSYDFQRQHLTMTQDLARARLHVTLHAFGAPGNDVDSTTTRVIDENSDILVWLNGNPASRKILLNEGSCDIESPIFHPNYARFAAEYNPLTRCYLFGFHPREWDDQGFGEFSRIIDFLIDSGVTFVTPTQYGESFPSRPQILAGG
ncbi:MAG TPA: DUF2334 domain-containing protein [Bacteroidota bacterium]|nr:DUF2334 domain-containing protein [Bacteroidota bacterium]